MYTRIVSYCLVAVSTAAFCLSHFSKGLPFISSLWFSFLFFNLLHRNGFWAFYCAYYLSIIVSMWRAALGFWSRCLAVLRVACWVLLLELEGGLPVIGGPRGVPCVLFVGLPLPTEPPVWKQIESRGRLQRHSRPYGGRGGLSGTPSRWRPPLLTLANHTEAFRGRANDCRESHWHYAFKSHDTEPPIHTFVSFVLNVQ